MRFAASTILELPSLLMAFRRRGGKEAAQSSVSIGDEQARREVFTINTDHKNHTNGSLQLTSSDY